MAIIKRVKAASILVTATILSVSSAWSDSTPEAAVAPRPLMVSGTVLDEFEGGLAGARVELVAMASNFSAGQRRLEGLPGPEPVAVARSDEEGHFRLEPTVRGVYRVVVHAAGRAPVQYFPLVAVDDIELPPVLPPLARRFEVRVKDPAGAPLVETWVFADGASPWSGSGWRLEFRRARTDSTGRAMVVQLEGERLAVTAFPAAAPSVTHAGFSGEALTLTAVPGVERRIWVLGGDRKPLEGILVRAGDLAWPVGFTDAAGRLALFARRGESLKIRLYAADGRHRLARLPALAGDGTRGTDEVEISLRDPTLLVGRILGSKNRQPLPGVVVWPGSDPGAWVAADTVGRYRLTATESERFWLQAEAAGHLPGLIRFAKLVPGEHRVSTQALEVAVGVRGRVVDGAGRHLSDVRLTALRSSSAGRRPFVRPDRAEGRGTTNDQGSFELRSLAPDGRYELVAVRPGFTTGTLTVRAPGNRGRGLEKGERPKPLEIVLHPARAAVGRVVDLDEVPVVGAEITTAPTGVHTRAWQTRVDASKPDPSRGRSDAEGYFRLAALPASEMDLRVRASGYAPTTVRGIEVPPGSGAADLGTIVLTRGAKVSGRVVDGRGEGIEGAAIHTLPHQLFPDLATESRLDRRRPEAVSGADGGFLLGDLAVRSQVDLLVRAAGFLPGRLRAVGVPAPVPVTVELERGAGIHGWVLAADEQPIEGAEIFLEWRQMLSESDVEVQVGPPSSGRAVSDQTGFFELSGARPGKAVLQVSADGFVTSEPMDLEVPEAGSSKELTLVLDLGAVVEGVVLTSEEEPIAGVRIALGEASSLSDAEGVYRVEGVAEGALTAEAYHPRYERQRQEVAVEPGSNTLDWELPVGQEVRGRVVDGTGEPVAGALVRLRRVQRGYREQRQHSSADGTFIFSPVAAGDFRLHAEGEGYAPTEHPATVTVADQAVADLEVVLRPGSAVRGQVLGLDYDQLASVEVSAYRPETVRSWRARVDYEGNYEITDLPAGDWVVQAALRTGHRQVEERVSVAPAAEVHRDLEFVPRLVFTGRLLLDEEPLPDAVISLRGFEVAAERSVSTDYQGAFRFEDLDVGRYWLGVQHSIEWVVHNDAVELRGDHDLTIRLERATVSGHVLADPEGQPISGAMITLLTNGDREVGGMIGGSSDSSGFFSLPRVSPGSYRMTVKKSGYAPAVKMVEVPAGSDLRGLEVHLSQTPGLELVVRLASGAPPPRVNVLVLEPGGAAVAAETRPVDAEGRAHLQTVPPGAWELLVSSSGGALTQIVATAPGEPVSVVLPPAGPLDVRVPALVTSNRLATVTLSDSEGRFLRVFDDSRTLQNRWQLLGGKATIPRVPAGSWTLRVEASDGRTWTGSAVTAGSPGGGVIIE